MTEATLQTMVEEAYVNHIPVMSVGQGRDALRRFHGEDFIPRMLPGLAPTGREVKVALVAIVRFAGGQLVREHIYWDQASVLVQLALLDPAGLPVRGVESALKACQAERR